MAKKHKKIIKKKDGKKMFPEDIDPIELREEEELENQKFDEYWEDRDKNEEYPPQGYPHL